MFTMWKKVFVFIFVLTTFIQMINCNESVKKRIKKRSLVDRFSSNPFFRSHFQGHTYYGTPDRWYPSAPTRPEINVNEGHYRPVTWWNVDESKSYDEGKFLLIFDEENVQEKPQEEVGQQNGGGATTELKEFDFAFNSLPHFQSVKLFNNEKKLENPEISTSAPIELTEIKGGITYAFKSLPHYEQNIKFTDFNQLINEETKKPLEIDIRKIETDLSSKVTNTEKAKQDSGVFVFKSLPNVEENVSFVNTNSQKPLTIKDTSDGTVLMNLNNLPNIQLNTNFEKNTEIQEENLNVAQEITVENKTTTDGAVFVFKSLPHFEQTFQFFNHITNTNQEAQKSPDVSVSTSGNLPNFNHTQVINDLTLSTIETSSKVDGMLFLSPVVETHHETVSNFKLLPNFEHETVFKTQEVVENAMIPMIPVVEASTVAPVKQSAKSKQKLIKIVKTPIISGQLEHNLQFLNPSQAKLLHLDQSENDGLSDFFDSRFGQKILEELSEIPLEKGHDEVYNSKIDSYGNNLKI